MPLGLREVKGVPDERGEEGKDDVRCMAYK
jgi:hypothetical protein